MGDVRVEVGQMSIDPTGAIVGADSFDEPQFPVGRLAVGASAILAIGLIAGWFLKPSVQIRPGSVSRFEHHLPTGQIFTRTGRPVVAIARDGSMIAYVADRQLYLRRLDQPEAVLIPGVPTDPNNPVFSPDGESIIFRQEGQLKRISTSGGTVTTLCRSTGLFGVSWGSDGMITYGQQDGIMQVPESGGEPSLLIPIEIDDGQVHGPQILPGDEWVLFTLAGPDLNWENAQVYVQSLGSDDRRLLVQQGTDARYLPTGHLTYVSEGTLYAAPLDLDSMIVGRAVPVSEGLHRPQYSGSAQYDFSDNGTLIRTTGTLDAGGRLSWVDRLGTVSPAISEVRNFSGVPRVSPDNNWIAATVTEPSGTEIWIYEVNSGSGRRLTDPEMEADNPVWNPQSEYLTFRSGGDIYWQAVDGSGLELLWDAPFSAQPSDWSPDGKTLLFEAESPETGWDLWILEIEGEDREAKPFLETEEEERRARFSRGGRWLSYTVGAAAVDQEIWVAPYPGPGSPRTLSTDGAQFGLWSTDGSEFFYSDLPRRELFVSTIQTDPTFVRSSPETVLPIPPTYVLSDVSGDDERFLFRHSDNQDRQLINITLNWFEELKERVPVP